jgi:hypothetical protein
MGRSGGPNPPNYLNHLDALLGDDFGLDRPETLVRDAAVVQIRGTKPRDGSDRKRFRSGTSGRDMDQTNPILWRLILYACRKCR